ncbi:DUF5069 domain-containing protein [Puniceicoccus vermicola]|uniref:DUF5069 domain-containing protein n=1 Tax=Puniceicoccus vermicola TaxID=388746 RepID=A0A7X1B0D9_9BACT|nr:DUF5069 domain-containing protein [Puniceicoccus vermicola]MBC2603159.1 DUF5069 domain-containing protein [Puniceicoccus vermicola]
MKSTPISAYEKTEGMLYFARMLDKIRKQASGDLRDDFQGNLGKGFDLRCTKYVRVDYDALRSRVLEGGDDKEILHWCYDCGRKLDENDILIWNEFIRKVGYRDFASESLSQRKIESGLGDRNEIETMLEYFEVDEGRA